MSLLLRRVNIQCSACKIYSNIDIHWPAAIKASNGQSHEIRASEFFHPTNRIRQDICHFDKISSSSKENGFVFLFFEKSFYKNLVSPF